MTTRVEQKSSRIAIVGGDGFIGANLASALIHRGVPVLSIDNGLFAPAMTILDLRASPLLTRVSADATSGEQINNAIRAQQVSAIINCVGPARPSFYRRYPIETAKTLIGSTVALLEQASNLGAVYIHASSSEIYGNVGLTLSENELGCVNTLSDRAAYAEAKRVCETLVWQHSRQFGLRVRILRLFNVYGPGFGYDDDRVVPNLLRSLKSQRAFRIQGDGEQVRSFCHVRDAAEAFVRAIRQIEPQQLCVNIGNPDPISILNLVRRVSQIAGRSIDVQFCGAVDGEIRYRCPDIGQARAHLNWSPKITLDEGIEELVRRVVDRE